MSAFENKKKCILRVCAFFAYIGEWHLNAMLQYLLHQHFVAVTKTERRSNIEREKKRRTHGVAKLCKHVIEYSMHIARAEFHKKIRSFEENRTEKWNTFLRVAFIQFTRSSICFFHYTFLACVSCEIINVIQSKHDAYGFTLFVLLHFLSEGAKKLMR